MLNYSLCPSQKVLVKLWINVLDHGIFVNKHGALFISVNIVPCPDRFKFGNFVYC